MFKFTSILIAALFVNQITAQFDERSVDDIPQNLTACYDMLVFSQSWPQTSCWNLNKVWTTQKYACSMCQMPKNKNIWTIHGLWPSNKHGKHPSNCNDEKYNPNLLSSSLRTMMKEKWPTFNLKLSIDSFWSHEWSKHGTCAMALESTNTLPKYFSKSLQLLDQYNLGVVLADSGIIPGKTYNYSDLFTVIQNTLGVKTYIKCATNNITKEQYVQEFNVCFDKSFKLTDCSDENRTNCKSEIIYPRNANTC
ncbi:ribonuclease Phyb-like [Phymastichus coffea]|uniref:ribonuclease Phyb-like n=1 Tax=Phymastichus coffea TaxID=108790 RepID=UPI00273BF8EE|nr:ribonuclease Phyb-like [Phymastichus coffea]